MFTSFIGFLITITIIVFVHEMGHYIVARICGVRVTDFAVGFGKPIFSIKDKHGTNWKLGYIPMGGYVKMYGDLGVASDQDDAILAKLTLKERVSTFSGQKPLNKAFIAAAGPFFNYLLSFIILFTLYMSHGKVQISNVVGEVIENSPAYNSGIREGDRIVSINGYKTDSFDKIFGMVSIRPNEYLNLVIDRGASEDVKLGLISSEREIRDENGKLLGKIGSIGIKSTKPEQVNLNAIEAIKVTLDDIYMLSIMTFTSLKQMILGSRSLDDLRGPITIAEESGNSMSSGVNNYLFFIAMLSINIGFVNFLPVPILDGGHIMFSVYEIITRKKPSYRVKSFLNKIGLVFIIFLFVISTSNDIKALLFR